MLDPSKVGLKRADWLSQLLESGLWTGNRRKPIDALSTDTRTSDTNAPH